MLLGPLGPKMLVLVINPDMKAVHELFQDTVKYAYQEEQLGTGHAVQVARDAVDERTGEILVLCGDTPLLSRELLQDLVAIHRLNTRRPPPYLRPNYPMPAVMDALSVLPPVASSA